MVAPTLEDVRAAMHRLFIDCAGASLRKEDEQKSLEVTALLHHLLRIKRGAHLVDAAAGKSSVGLVAAELLPIARLTVIERDPGRVAACEAAARRLTRAVPVEVRRADVVSDEAWPESPDAVVALHACGPASDLVVEGAIRCRARRLFLVPCCYGARVPFAARAAALLAEAGLAEDDLLGRRMCASLVDLERKLRLEAAGFETSIAELVAPTVTPHNLLFVARRTVSEVRMARARERLAALHASRAP